MGGYVARSGAVSGVLHPLEVRCGLRGLGARRRCSASPTCSRWTTTWPGRPDGRGGRGGHDVRTWSGCARPTRTPGRCRRTWRTSSSRRRWRRPVRLSATRDGVRVAAPGRARRSRWAAHRLATTPTVPVEVLRVADPIGSSWVCSAWSRCTRPSWGPPTPWSRPTCRVPSGGRCRPRVPGRVVATGAAGDVSTRSAPAEQTPAEVDRLGALAARAVLEAASARRCRGDGRRGGWVSSVMLEPADPGACSAAGALESARQTLAAARESGDAGLVRDAAVGLEGAELATGVTSTSRVSLTTASLDLGGFRLLGLGGEPFLDLAPGGSTCCSAMPTGTPATSPPAPPSPTPPPTRTARRTRS